MVEVAHAVEESAGAGLAVASHLGTDGQNLAAAVNQAFSSGLSSAMSGGAAIALVTAALVFWWAPRRAVAPVEEASTNIVGSHAVPDRVPELVR